MSLSLQQMENYITGAKMAIDAANSPEKVEVMASITIAHSLLVIAECALRREMREG